MGGIKYYQLAKGEEMPDEFCVVRDVNGEPSEYMFYVPEAENAKLRELVREVWFYAEQELVCDENCPYGAACDWKDCVFTRRMRELGVEVD